VQFDTSEIDYLADPSYKSGYRNVIPLGRDTYAVSFRYSGRVIAAYGFLRPSIGAAFIADFYKKRHGEEWYLWATCRTDFKKNGGVYGKGWQIRPIGDAEYILEICPCETWCTVEYSKRGRSTDIFESIQDAKKALSAAMKYRFPLFGYRILEPVPYQHPKRVVRLPPNIPIWQLQQSEPRQSERARLQQPR
jgi:hypothetical protein